MARRAKFGRGSRGIKKDAELDITSFMNLMIVLVPVLLMMMVFSRITVLELALPQLGEANEQNIDVKDQRLELVVRADSIAVYYPQGYLVKELVVTEQGYDYLALQMVLRQIKQTLINKNIDKKAATLLLEEDIPYQVIVALMDTTRSYQDVLIASVVDAELFPEISLGDAPIDIAPVASNESLGSAK
ncbi:biopolymer transporter ExbD [Paraglaciecola sp. MB-3u-78]|jgi:biopolymer transport protein ExbD|uniref:ExbD/TolR family protein n=1 Tax=Paraglaciecola sp. MB-3u-78 TaxID=2058332 RepID=UPI000C345075|nr:biopolymer transporter ExbD [Paraglaciecola sp. MB-3u-78]PKG98453.1 biopolymer transporter ExbD [Paraglaciecola sp. MB-3u-78]